MLDLTYVLPIRTAEPRLDLAPYLSMLAGQVEVIVVDGSEPAVFSAHAEMCGASGVRHVAVDPARVTPMGKVGGVMTGVALAAHDRVVVADDDVVYTVEQLRQVARLLDGADVVRPQNYFDPLPWHARWDTPRMLIGRATGGDWPGTMALRRSRLLRAGGYAGDVLFENLELERTIVAAGGRAHVALDVLVRRTPPTADHFVGQRVRQAYDEFARPARLVAALAVLPVLAATGRRGAASIAVASIALAESGRRRSGGQAVFPATSSLWAPAWVAERSITSWLAVWQRLRRGGVPYRDGVLRHAATPTRVLRERVAADVERQVAAAS